MPIRRSASTTRAQKRPRPAAASARPTRRQIECLLAFDLKIAAETDPDRLVALLAEETRQLLAADRCTVFLHDRITGELWAKLAHGVDPHRLRLKATDGIVGAVVTARSLVNIPDAYRDARFSRRVDQQTGYHTKTLLAAPMFDARGHDVLGVFEVLNKRRGPFTRTDEDLLTVLAKHAAVAVENAQLYQDLHRAHRETIFRLALMAEHRDPQNTAEHLRRVGTYTRLVAEALALPPEQVEALELVSALHDIGKIATPDAILLKTGKLTETELGAVEYRLAWWIEKLKLLAAPTETIRTVADWLEEIRAANRPSSTGMSEELIAKIRLIGTQRFTDRDNQEKPLLTDEEIQKLTIWRGNLTPEEWSEIQKHTVHGAEILAGASSDLMRMAERVALSHHEKYDGTGYPKRLIGDAIPLEGRIIGLADVFDALSSARVYKSQWRLEDVVAYIQQESGKHFDPRIVGAFLRALPQIERALNQLHDSPPRHAE